MPKTKMLETTDINPNQLYTRRAVASIACVCPHTIMRWERAGLIQGKRINRRVVRYPGTEVMKLIQGDVVNN